MSEVLLGAWSCLLVEAQITKNNTIIISSKLCVFRAKVLTYVRVNIRLKGTGRGWGNPRAYEIVSHNAT